MTTTQMTRLAWHFLHPDSRLRTGETAPDDGVWLKHDGPLVPCESGLHASERAIDALDYAPTEDRVVLCRVELRGEIVEHGNPVDKLAASERRILWRLDSETTDAVLREFSRWAARQVLHLWDAPEIVVRYLETGDESLGDAAWAAAEAAAWAAAEAADAAARSAARAAAWAARDAAARSAARAVAWAARAAAEAADAAWAAAAAAWGAADAAWDATLDAQNTELERLFNAAHDKRGKAQN